MKNLTKSINRLVKAMEIQNKQLEQLREKDNNALGFAMLAMMFNSPWNKPDADFYKKLQEDLKQKC